ncbi:MAG: endonuclease [Oscillatoriales cyanobacterium RM2_1_1]|nr:endonuclease [Oscillatoriales cyanobacterium SM2_3_0]NJO45269.1 endonuclease [Oscillatoriales cyanobacterium RM2_1_1]
MSVGLRIATFNVENLDDKPSKSAYEPKFEERVKVLRPQLQRLHADILCLQEVNSQQEPDGTRHLRALDRLLQDTPYATYHRAVTQVEVKGKLQFNSERNLVILSRFEMTQSQQYLNTLTPALFYQTVTANPPETSPEAIRWERPILHATVKLPGDQTLEVLNLHLKSKHPTVIPGQMQDRFTWKTASGWAEGFFISSMKRVGQALETRLLIDQLFDQNEGAFIVVCGDFNADFDEVPVEAIRGQVENTGNGDLSPRVLVPCENTIPETSRYTLFHRGKKCMLDHLLVSRSLLAYYEGAEIHNELLPDESIAFATDKKFPESDHGPVIAKFQLD